MAAKTQAKKVIRKDNTSDLHKLFEKYREKDGRAPIIAILEEVGTQGIHVCTDQRFLTTFHNIKATPGKCLPEMKADFDAFEKIVTSSDLLQRALAKNLIVPNFEEFSKNLELLFFAQAVEDVVLDTKDFREFCTVTTKDTWGVGFFSIDGQKWCTGDHKCSFTMKSCIWPLLYAFVLQNVGKEKYHEYCSYEPISSDYTEMDLTSENIPYNPLTIAGALISCALWQTDVHPEISHAERFEKFLCFLMQMSCGERLTCNNVVVIDERDNSDLPRAILYNLAAMNCLPPEANPEVIIEYFFQANAIEIDCAKLALIGSTLANEGINTFSGQTVLSPEVNKSVLTVMQTCGLPSLEEDIIFEVGLPLKFSSSGAGILIVPGLFAIACFSPYLNENCVSKRGIKFIKSLSSFYNFHPHESGTWMKIPCALQVQPCGINCSLFNAVTHGQIDTVASLLSFGVSTTTRDYMKRTILHYAATNGHIKLCKFIVSNCPCLIEAKDIMDKTPYDDAVHFDHKEIAQFLKQWMDLRKPPDEKGRKAHSPRSPKEPTMTSPPKSAIAAAT